MKFKEFKQIVFQEISNTLVTYGFKSIKSKELFLKVNMFHKVEINLGFLNFSPDRFEYHFATFITFPDLEKLFTMYYEYHGEVKKNTFSNVLFEGDFISDLEGLEPKFRNSYYNVILEIDDLKTALDKTTNIIEKKLIPELDKLSTLDRFQDYISLHKEKLLLNITRNELIISSLFAMYLKSKDDYKNLYAFLFDSLRTSSAFSEIIKYQIILLEKINSFIDSLRLTHEQAG